MKILVIFTHFDFLCNPWPGFNLEVLLFQTNTLIYYRPQTKLRKGNVFTPVCDSVHGGVYTPWTHTHTPGHPPPETVTAADGTHPTGMHSC